MADRSPTGSSPARVLCIGNRYPPWSLGGYEAIWSSAVAALRDAGHPTRVLTTVPDPSDRPVTGSPPPDVHRALRWYWREHLFPSLSLRETVRLERANGRVLARQLREHAPDVVFWWSMGGMSLSLIEQVRRAGIPAVGLVADDWMLYGPRVDGWTRRWRGPGRVFAGAAEGASGIPARPDLDRAARWLFISRYLLESARRAGYRVPGAEVLSPGVDPARFPWREPGAWRWRLLYCGRLDPRKGVGTAIEALALLPAEASLTLDGDGDAEYANELRGLASRLGVQDRVRFAHSASGQVASAYADADAVVFPVRWHEPWGLVPLEAMSVGRPVLASRAGGGPAEYLREGENCVQFEPGDAPALAETVRLIAGDAGLREQIVSAGKATAARYTEQSFNDALVSIVKGVAAG